MLNAPLRPLADPLGDADRGAVLRVDEADDAVLPQHGGGMRQGRPGSLRGVAMPPPAARQRPGELASGPPRRLGEADRSQERAGLLVLDSPHSEALELPVPQ